MFISLNCLSSVFCFVFFFYIGCGDSRLCFDLMGKAWNSVKHLRHTSLSGEILLVQGLMLQLLPGESAQTWD